MSKEASRAFESRAPMVETISGEAIALCQAGRGRAYRAQSRPTDVDAPVRVDRGARWVIWVFFVLGLRNARPPRRRSPEVGGDPRPLHVVRE